MDTVQKLFRFLDESPTCYHAAANAKAALTAAGVAAVPPEAADVLPVASDRRTWP